MPWDFKRYGSPADPVHKSHLNAITGDYGCPRKFKYEMDARADAAPGIDERQTISGKAAIGTAAHETITRALSNEEVRAALWNGSTISVERVERVLEEEYKRELGGRTPQWYADDAEDGGTETIDNVAIMVRGILNSLPRYVHEIVAMEAGFIAPVGDYWISGHVDLIYRPRANPTTLALADWKTGKVKPLEIELDHGWEAGVYACALRHGYWLRREHLQSAPTNDGRTWVCFNGFECTHPSRYIAERTVMEQALSAEACAWAGQREVMGRMAAPWQPTFNLFPSEIHTVQASDFVPYKKAGSKMVKRPEDLRFYHYDSPRKHKYEAGQPKGPAWLPVKLSEYDLPRLDARLRNVVGMIRMGRFIDQVGSRCLHCSYARDCLTHGYAPRGDERDQLERALRALGTDAHDGLED